MPLLLSIGATRANVVDFCQPNRCPAASTASSAARKSGRERDAIAKSSSPAGCARGVA